MKKGRITSFFRVSFSFLKIYRKKKKYARKEMICFENHGISLKEEMETREHREKVIFGKELDISSARFFFLAFFTFTNFQLDNLYRLALCFFLLLYVLRNFHISMDLFHMNNYCVYIWLCLCITKISLLKMVL